MSKIISIYLFLAVLVTCYMAAYVFTKKSVYTIIFSVLNLCVCLYLLGYLFELNSTSLDQLVFWNQVQYFGLPFIPGLWLLMVLLYTKRIQIIRETTLVCLLIIPILTFFIRLTNSLHHLYYSSFELRHSAFMTLLHLQKGPWYYVQSLYILASFILINIVFYREYRQSRSADQNRFRMLLVASVLPNAGLLLVLADFIGLGLDYAALLMPVSLYLILIAIVKFDFLEIKTLARETVFENSTDVMLLLNKEQKILDYNKAANLFFFSLDLTLQKDSLKDILGVKHELFELLKSDAPIEFATEQEGQKRTFEINSEEIFDTYGRNIGTLKSIRDITERKRMQEELKILATVDSLSGLNNRAHFMQLAHKEIERAKRYGHGFSVLMMDLDNFKETNDTFGHAGGDAVIREIGRLISNSFRKTDIAGRIGGEEFAVVLPNTYIEDARLAAEQFRKSVADKKVVFDQSEITMTISIGASCYFDKAQSIDQILRYADEGLYESKKRGRNRVTVKCQMNK